MRKKSRTAPRSAAPSLGDPAPPRTPWAERIAFGLVALLILITPLAMWSDAKDPFRLPKLLLAGILGAASLCALSFGRGLAERWDLPGLWRRAAVRAVLPFVAVAALSWLWTRHRAYVGEGLIDLLVGASCLVAWSLALDSERLRRLLELTFWPALVLSVVAVSQYLDIWEPLKFAQGEETHRLGVTGFAGNPGDLGSFLVLPCLLAQAQLARLGRDGLRRPAAWIAAGTLVLSAIAIVTTQSLTAVAGLGVGTVVLWALLLPQRRALAIAGGGALLALVALLAVAPLRERVVEKWGDLTSGNVNRLLTGRLDGWRAAIWMFEQAPVGGVGFGAYRARFGDARLALVDEGVEFFRSQETPVFANAHNEYLEVAAEGGLLGLAALGWGLWVLGGTLRRQRAGAAASRDRRADFALAAAGLATLAVMALTFFQLRIALTGFPSLLFLAWAFRSSEEAGG
ncbi:MAG TPA: O-antigen ligase family protein [Thermoanaerobaculia bacterium]|nr:O-antigen ligase family protein [Thermoanaerobaculia bacterium]